MTLSVNDWFHFYMSVAQCAEFAELQNRMRELIVEERRQAKREERERCAAFMDDMHRKWFGCEPEGRDTHGARIRALTDDEEAK